MDSGKILTQKDIYKILPFGKTKIKALLMSGNMPVVKIGRDYVTTEALIGKWIEENLNKTIEY